MSRIFLLLLGINVSSLVLFQVYIYLLNGNNFNYGVNFISLLNANNPKSVIQEFEDITYIEKSSDYITNLPLSPYILGNQKKGPKFLGNQSCARFPSVYDIKFGNVIWQLQTQKNWTFNLFGAYWDVRVTNEANKNGPRIRILGMVNKMYETIEDNYCQIWFENQKEPLITKVVSYIYLWVKYWGNYDNISLQPYLMTCPMPKNFSGSIPTSVSLVPSPCTAATNNLRVHFDKPAKKEMFAVCVKGMDFILADISARLVEWIELLYIFGVDKIYFYDLAVHPNVKKVFKYYEKLNRIHVFPLTLAGSVPNEPHLRHSFLKNKYYDKRQQELIPYNDCLYRNMYKYKYISLLDIDEIIVPHNNKASNWADLVHILENKNTANFTPYFVFAKVDFTSVINVTDSDKELETIPDYFYMLQHTTRSSEDVGTNRGVKCFHLPENVITIHNHFPINCINYCQSHSSFVYVNVSDGFLHHYNKYGRQSEGNRTMTFITDRTLWRWKNDLIAHSHKVLRKLELI